MVAREPGQDRKVAALSGYYHVPQGCPVSRLCREFFILASHLCGAFFVMESYASEGFIILLVEKLQDL